MTRRETHEQLLIRVLSGELADDDPLVTEAERADPEFGEALDALRDVQGGLEAAAVRERVLADAHALDWPEGEDRIRELVSRASATAPSSADDEPVATTERTDVEDADAPPRTIRWLWLPIAAAALVAVVTTLGWPPFDGSADRRGPVFLGDELPGATPSGPVESYARFEWSKPLPPGWTFEVRVYDDTEAARGAELAGVDGLRTEGWTPEAATEDWPDAILWTLDLERPGGERVEGYSVRAWRSPR